MKSAPNSMLHPATHFLIALEFVCIAVTLPTVAGFAILGLFFLLALVLPPRTEFNLTGKFLKILGFGALFLFLIHGISVHPIKLSREGLGIGAESFVHIAAPVIGVIYLSRRILSEELFAMLVDYHVPPSLILILFRTMWLVPRLIERIDEVVTAQKLRGMRIETAGQRIRALIPTLNPIFSSMFGEISINSLTITARGFLSPGMKTHIVPLSYSRLDAVVIAGLTLLWGILWC